MTARRRARRDLGRLGLVVLLGAVGGCRRATSKSGDPGGGSPAAVGSSVVPVATVDPHPPSALDRDKAASAATVPAGGRPALPPGAGSGLARSEPVGGPWVSCYANFRATSTPERDVARLAALCGPPNGMVPAAPVTAGDAVDAAENHRLDVHAGDCFRIFAVADTFVSDLGIEVINPRGNAVTWDRNGDRWPIMNPDGPFCLFDAGTYTVRVRALQGRGRYAMQVWRLPVPP
ncbi:MAG: hypothetical protein ABW133_05510 [Polyangiaceae bacterium]